MTDRITIKVDGYTLTLDEQLGAVSVKDGRSALGSHAWLDMRTGAAMAVLVKAHDRLLQSMISMSAGITVEVSRKVWEREQARLGELEQENARLRRALETIAGRDCWNATETASFALTTAKDHADSGRIQEQGEP